MSVCYQTDLGLAYPLMLGFPDSSAGKESTCNAGNPGSIPGSGRSTGEGIGYVLQYSWASLMAELERICLQCRRPGFNPWVGKIPWRRERLPTPVFLPGESHEQRSLAGYSPWGYKELDITEQSWHKQVAKETQDRSSSPVCLLFLWEGILA